MKGEKMKISSLFFYLKRYKNLILAVLIYTLSFCVAEFLAYELSLRLLIKDTPLAGLICESFSHALFLYGAVLVLSMVIVCLFRVLGFFRKRDVEILLENKTKELRQENKGLLDQISSYYSIMHQTPVGMMLTQKNQVQECNEAMDSFLRVNHKKAIGKNISDLFFEKNETLEK